jgi:hypothetical protein
LKGYSIWAAVTYRQDDTVEQDIAHTQREMRISSYKSKHEFTREFFEESAAEWMEKYWPADVDLMVYAENCQPWYKRSNTQVIDILSASTNLQEFVKRHENNPLAHGQAGPPEVWNPKKQFRWNAVRFCYKVFATAACSQQTPNGWLIWMDADTHTHSAVTLDWLNAVCPTDAMASYLGRGEKYHS